MIVRIEGSGSNQGSTQTGEITGDLTNMISRTEWSRETSEALKQTTYHRKIYTVKLAAKK